MGNTYKEIFLEATITPEMLLEAMAQGDVVIIEPAAADGTEEE